MFLKMMTLAALVTVSSLTMAADKKDKKEFEPSEKRCAKVVKMIEKSADNEKRLKGLNKRKAKCEEAGF
ncbi:hypothetical protein RS130_20980 [Paraglaciecola aquimarina]|uniref:PsiF repeat-containing protein n=1 Tax=Paraglaciecola aquimarina TaxID=1235557 RepID=A0ABU3T188_9ALTE|nr:hypothetical protein [Paraglaciecola aquimarina]MDU0356032.1 hypothetical protein [Paraglaciecola aquimarina]